MRLHRASFALALLVTAAPFAACINNGPAPALPSVDGSLPPAIDAGIPFVPDAGTDSAPVVTPDAGSDAAETGPSCAVQPALLALGADAGGTVVANDFTCAAGLDLDGSTAVLDFTGAGYARAPQTRQLSAVGDGGEGAYASDSGPLPDGGGFASIAPGTHDYASFELDDGIAFANGDLTVNVAGPLTLAGSATLYVQGNLLIVASGPIRLEGILYVAGDVTIEQPTGAGVTIGASVEGTTQVGGIYSGYATAGSASNPPLTTTSPGVIEIDTRGAIALPNGYLYTNAFGADSAAKSGDITLRAYGDIAFGGVYNADAGTGQSSYMYVGSPCPPQVDAGACALGANGNMRLYSEGSITFDYSSFVYAGDLSTGVSGGNLSVHAAAGVHLRGSSFVYAGYAGSLDVLSQGPVTFDGDSYAYAGQDPGLPTNVTVRAQSLRMTNDSYAYAGGNGGAVAIASTGDVTLDTGSYMYAADGTCAPGGSFAIDAEGTIAIANGAYVFGGNSQAGAGCAAAGGGNVVLRAGGTISAPVPDAGTPPVNPGVGVPNGTVTQTPNAPVLIGVLDAQLEPSVKVVSLPIASASSAFLFGATGATDPAAFFGAHVLVSPDGTAAGFTSVPDALGKPLPSGWRYALVLQPRMFDPSAADGLVLRVQ